MSPFWDIREEWITVIAVRAITGLIPARVHGRIQRDAERAPTEKRRPWKRELLSSLRCILRLIAFLIGTRGDASRAPRLTQLLT